MNLARTTYHGRRSQWELANDVLGVGGPIVYVLTPDRQTGLFVDNDVASWLDRHDSDK